MKNPICTSTFLAVLASLAGPVFAADLDCATNLNAKSSSGTALLTCLEKLQNKINQLNTAAAATSGTQTLGLTEVNELIQDAVTPVQSALNIANRQITTLSKELAPFRNAVGAVVAFDGFSGCPEGWSTYTPATSRVIVGAGDDFHPKHREWSMMLPTGGEQRKDLEAYEPQSSGGELLHILTPAEVPRHDHFVMARGQGEVSPGNNSAEVVAQWGKHKSDANYHYSFRMFEDRVADWGKSSAAGGDPDQLQSAAKPHNTMPPYIALSYCKRD